MCPGPHQNNGPGWRHETGLSPPVKYFNDGSKAVLLLWIICVIYVFCFFMLSRLFIAALRSPAGKGLTFWLLLGCLIFFLWYPGSGVVLDNIDS